MALGIIELSDLSGTPKIKNTGAAAIHVRADMESGSTRLDPGEEIELPISESGGSLITEYDVQQEKE
jgi:hypothetical protein